MRLSFRTFVTVGCVSLAGCASAPPLSEKSIGQARSEVRALMETPGASEVAAREIATSRTSLEMAEDALKKKEVDQLEHFSYLTLRQARMGEARVDERQALQQLANGESERIRILLSARDAELEAQKKLAARETERGMVLTLSGILFDTGTATLNAGAAPSLDRVSQFMTQYPQTRLIIEGHTDSAGEEMMNLRLSQSRADAVAEALLARGVSRDRVEIIGRGPYMPVASNGTSAGRQQNRRVEMIFSDGSGRFATGARGMSR
jgi:outer membrane protein OmpA-like peptidoglycan-associated protein